MLTNGRAQQEEAVGSEGERPVADRHGATGCLRIGSERRQQHSAGRKTPQVTPAEGHGAILDIPRGESTARPRPFRAVEAEFDQENRGAMPGGMAIS